MSDAAKKSERKPWPRWLWALVAMLAIGGFAMGYWGLLSGFLQEARRRAASFMPGTAAGEDHVLVRASVLSLDATKDALSLRLLLSPRGRFTRDNRTPATTLRLRTNGFRGASLFTFKAGERMGATEVSVQIWSGDVEDYPLDAYRSNLALRLEEVLPGGGVRPVPMRIEFQRVLHGLRPSATLAKRSTDGSAALRIHIERATGTKFFAFIVMGIMAVLTLLTLSVSSAVVFKGRRPEFSAFSWMGAMLFAFPAIRNALPGQPPMGSFIDYLVFFWAEGLVALALVAAVSAWLSRPQQGK